MIAAIRDDGLWTSAELANATGGRIAADCVASGVSIDTRTLIPGDLFVALRGPRFDGHDFVATALAKGAAAAMVDRDPPGVGAGAPLLRVGDTLTGLGDLGRFARARTGARIIGVTGSVGKTGTKEGLRRALAAQGVTAASEGSLNNHWGLPLSLARMPREARFAVLEMGMNHAGEIASLSRLARPHVAVITTVEAVHIEFFASVEAIADAKAEIFAGMDSQGVAVLNRDNRHFRRLVAAARRQGLGAVLSFGVHPDADARLIETQAQDGGSRVVARVMGSAVAYEIGLAGRHWVTNSLAMLLAAYAVGADVPAAAAALADLKPLRGRGIRHAVPLGEGDFLLIDESYNASPVSMEAALAVLGQEKPARGGRRVAVLGDMLELGAQADALHADLASRVERQAVDLVFTAGRHMARLAEALPAARRGGHAADSAALAPLVRAAVRAGDVVMVKGSAGSRMGLVVEALRALAHDARAGEPPLVCNGE